jgi:hypothetical protein
MKLLFLISCNSFIDTVSLRLIKDQSALFNLSISSLKSLIAKSELKAEGYSVKKELYFWQ